MDRPVVTTTRPSGRLLDSGFVLEGDFRVGGYSGSHSNFPRQGCREFRLQDLAAVVRTDKNIERVLCSRLVSDTTGKSRTCSPPERNSGNLVIAIPKSQNSCIPINRLRRMPAVHLAHWSNCYIVRPMCPLNRCLINDRTPEPHRWFYSNIDRFPNILRPT